MEKIQPVSTLTPKQAAKIIGKDPDYIRVGLRLGRFDFGSAVPPREGGKNWSYNIIESKFLKYADINNVER